MTVESRDSAQSHKSSALSLPLAKLAQEKLAMSGKSPAYVHHRKN
jgi:hypothetical protein